MHARFISKLSNHGKVTIPAHIRGILDLRTGDTVAFKWLHGLVHIQKVDIDMAHADHQTLADEWNSAHDERAYRNL